MYRGEQKKNDLFFGFYGLIRLYMSVHFDENRLATDDEVYDFINITYANIWNLEHILTLDKDRIVDIMLLLTVVHRIYTVVLFYIKPLDVLFHRGFDSEMNEIIYGFSVRAANFLSRNNNVDETKNKADLINVHDEEQIK